MSDGPIIKESFADLRLRQHLYIDSLFIDQFPLPQLYEHLGIRVRPGFADLAQVHLSLVNDRVDEAHKLRVFLVDPLVLEGFALANFCSLAEEVLFRR